jgi:hypothetical protein
VTAGSKAILLPLWAERAVVAVIVVVILVASLFVTAWPRLVTRVSGEGLQTALTEARSSARSLEVSLRAPEGPLDRHRSLAEEFRDGHMSSTLEMAFPAALLMAESPRLVVNLYPGTATPTHTTDLVLRHYDAADGHVTVTSGSLTGDGGTLPMGSGPGCPELPLGTPRTEWEEAVDPDGDWFTQCQLWNIPVIEAAFTSRTLDALGLTVGDRLMVQADVLGASGLAVGLAKVVEVSAEIAINNPGDGFWFGDDRLHVPAMTLNNDLDIVAVHAVGLFHPSDYQRLTAVGWPETLPNLYFRHPVDPAAVGPESAARFADDLRAIQLRRLTDNLASASVATGMVPVIEDYLTDRGRAMAVLAASLFGVGAVALGLIWVLAALLHNRNRSSLVLLRSRGGTPGQLVRSQLLQVGMLSIPTVALAYLLSSWLYPTASPLSMGLAVGFGLLVPVSYVAASRQATTADLSSIHEAHQPAGSRRVLLFEGVVAVIAVGAFLLIQRRDPLGSGEADLLVAAVPALAALAAGLLALRLMPALIGLGARVSRRLTGVIVFMGLRRVRQETARFKPALLVLVLAVALAGFTLATRASIHEDQARAVYVEVGADYRVTGSFPGQLLDVDLSGIAGIEHTAQAAMMPAARSSIDGRNRDDRVNFVGLDRADYASVVADTPIDPGVLGPLVGSDGSGTRDNPIPAVISSDWASPGPPARGELFTVELGASSPWFVVADIRDRFPGVEPGQPYVIASREAVESAGSTAAMTANLMLVRGAPETLSDIEAEVIAWNPEARVESSAANLEEVRNRPLARAVDLGLGLSLVTLVAFTALAAVLLVALRAQARARDVGYLQVLGMGTGQVTGMTTIELATTVTVATAVGLGVGIGSTGLMADQLGLGTVTTPGAAWFIAVVGAVTLISLIAMRLVAGTGRRRPLSSVLDMERDE